MINFHNADELQTWLVGHILNQGSKISCRGKETLEIYPFQFCLDNPLNRCITNPKRKWSMPLALGETIWNLRGDRNVEAISYYAPYWKKLYDSNQVTGSCYGYKAFSNETSQWTKVKNLLKEEPDSRRAVITFFDAGSALSHNNPDVSCTLSFQFLLRNNKLDAITTMRSNDVIWGLPYDIFFFTFLQEKMASELGVQMGRYFHQVSSVHIYKRHYSLAEEIRDSRYNSYQTMQPMEEHDLVQSLIREEEIIRTADVRLMNTSYIGTEYWEQLRKILLCFRFLKEELTLEALDLIDNSYYKSVLLPMLPKQSFQLG